MNENWNRKQTTGKLPECNKAILVSIYRFDDETATRSHLDIYVLELDIDVTDNKSMSLISSFESCC